MSLSKSLVVGATRGMSEAHAAMERATGSALPPLNEITMFEAAELMAATLLGASAACEEAREMPAASRKVGRVILAYIKPCERNEARTRAQYIGRQMSLHAKPM